MKAKILSVLFFIVATFVAQTSHALSTSTGNAIANAALTRIGTPYVWGGKTTAGFDCSGFASWCYRQNGYSNMPLGTAHTQMGWCWLCTTQRGALIFFDTDYNGVIDHVAIQDTPGYMIHSAYGQGVVRQPITNWYQARRVTSASR